MEHPAVTEREMDVSGTRLHVWEAGEGPPVVLAHGFPELGYSWRHQLPVLAAAGYRVVAPDQRGYGRSDRPPAIEDYDISALTGDLLGLLDLLEAERGVFVGHDWGAMVVWQLSLLAPDRVAGVVGMSVPFTPRPPMPPTQLFRQALGDSFFYMLHFQEPGVADAELDADPERVLRRMMAGSLASADEQDVAAMFANDGRGFVERLPEPDGLPDWLAPPELDHYVEEFRRTGFTGGLNWYRNLDRNWELTEHLAGATVAVPAAFVGGSLDPVLRMTPPEIMDGWLDDDRGRTIVEGAGHWVQQERPDEVNRALLEFLAGLDLAG